MFITNELTEEQKIEFQDYISQILAKIKIEKTRSTRKKLTYRGDPVEVESDNFFVEEYFEDEEDLNRFGRQPLNDGYEKDNFAKLEDGRICIKSVLKIPLSDRRSEKKEIDYDPRLIVAYMNYPLVRKFAPNILLECINKDIQEYQTKDSFGSFLASFNGMNVLRKDYEIFLKQVEKEQKMINQNNI